MASIFGVFVLALVPCSLGLAATPCQDPSVAELPFCNYKLDVVDRVSDLLGRLTVSEKISQLGNSASSIDKLTIPAYQWWSEALHGVANSPGVKFGGKVPSATSFPQVIGLGATFNMTLIHLIGQVISTEGRAMYNVGQSGLSYFAPFINIYRDPRWGRGQETPGEDPYLTSQYAIQFVRGMQEGNDARYLKSAACCKCLAAYDLENWNGTDRHHFNAVVEDQDLIETYFPAFEACVREGRVASIMCSYNAVNGVPSCANDLFQNQVLRDQWGFQGFIVSDCGAISGIESAHHYTTTTADTVQVALRGGTDLNCGSFYQKNAQDAYNKGKINDDDLNLAVGRLFAYRIILGLFDPPNIQAYWNITVDHVNSPSHQALALDAARESMVLLKNDGTLPLSKSKKVALIGPNSNATTTMQGNYNGVAPYLIGPLEGIQKMGVSVESAMGCNVACQDDSGFATAINVAKSADVVIVVVGLDEGQEGEGHDRTVLTLPGKQLDLLQAISSAISTPLIVMLMSGGPVDISWAKDHANGVVWTGYPGQSGGQALAEVLYGVVNPSGRLPITIYPADYVNQISFFNMSMRASPGRTYKFYTGTPVYQFGDGLSYTTFTYTWSGLSNQQEDHLLNISKSQLRERGAVNYQVKVTNTGKMAGSVSVLAFMTSDVPGAPLKQLFGFQKVFLPLGESVDLFFAASAKDFMIVDKQGQKQLNAGHYRVQIGNLLRYVNIV